MNPLNARTFGTHDPDDPQVPRARNARSNGRPALGRDKRITLYLPPEIVLAYEQEAERRWPTYEKKRGELMLEALEAWLAALASGALGACTHVLGCGCVVRSAKPRKGHARFDRPTRSTRSAPASAGAKQADSE